MWIITTNNTQQIATRHSNFQKGVAPIIAIFILAVILVCVGGAYYFKQQQVKNSPTVMNTINLSTGPNNYFIAQITAPSDYFATDDSMMDDYNSQGGMASPRLILMKNHQVFNNNYLKLMNNSANDCIVIFSTMSFSNINEWDGTITNFKGELKNQEILDVGSRKAPLYLRSMTNKSIYTAFLPIGDKSRTSYYFYTCNTNNKTDFINVIKSIKFRGDIKF